MAGGFMSSSGRFQGVLEPSRTVGDVDVKAEAPKGSIASYPEVTLTLQLLRIAPKQGLSVLSFFPRR